MRENCTADADAFVTTIVTSAVSTGVGVVILEHYSEMIGEMMILPGRWSHNTRVLMKSNQNANTSTECEPKTF